MELANNCPKLKQVRLVGAFELDNNAIRALVQKCVDLEYLEISGSDEQPGHVQNSFHLPLTAPTLLSPKLRKLVVLNQGLHGYLKSKSVNILTRKRPGLEVVFGATKGNNQHLMASWCGEVDSCNYPTKFRRTAIYGLPQDKSAPIGCEEEDSRVQDWCP